MKKLVALFVLLSAGAASALTTSFDVMEITLKNLKASQGTTLPINGVDRIEMKGFLKCFPGIYQVEVKAMARGKDGYTKEAYLDIEVGSCGGKEDKFSISKQTYN